MSLWDTIKKAVVDDTAQRLRLNDGFQVQDLAFWTAQGTLGQSGADLMVPQTGPVDPNAPVSASTALGEAQRGLYTNVVSRPLTAGLLALDNQDAQGVSAWDAAQYVSPGQVIVAGFNSGRLGTLGDQGVDSPRNQVNRAIVQRDRMDASDPGGAFKNNTWANLVSGAVDAGFQFGLDPLSVAGKGASVARRTQITRPLTEKNVAKLRDEVNTGVGGLATAIREMPTSFEGVMAHPMVRQSADPEALGKAMYLAGRVAEESADEADTAYALRAKVWLASSGDQAAIADLRTSRATLADQLDTLTGVKPKDVTPDLFDDLILRDKWLAATLGRADNAGAVNASVGRPTAAKSSVWEANKARRAEAMGRLNVGDDASYFHERVFQFGPGARTVRALRWMGQTRPSGTIRVDGLATDGYTDIQSGAMRVKSWTPEIRAEWGNRWAEASTASERSLVAADFRRAAVRAVVEEHGLAGKDADNYVSALLGRQDKVADEFRSNGYLVDGDEIVHDAMLTTQLRDSVPMIDIDYLYRVMPDTATLAKKRGLVGNVSRDTASMGRNAIDGFNFVIDEFWRPLVLMRGGYAPRNTSEAWARMAGQGMLGRVAREQGVDGVVAWLSNRAAGVGAITAKARFGEESAEYGAAKARVGNARRGGDGTLKLPGGVVADDALAGPGGAELVQEASAAGTLGASLKPGTAMGGARANADGTMPAGSLETSGWSEFRLDPDDIDDPVKAEKFFDGYTRIVNKQFLGDPIAKMLLEGRSRAEVKAWIRQNKQYGLRREYGLSRNDAADRVDTIGNYVDDLVPDELRPRILEKGGLSRQEYQDALANYDLGPIHVQNIQESMVGTGKQLLEAKRNVVKGVFKFIGQLPEDNLVRNPYVRDVYRRTMETNARIALRDGVTVTDDMMLGWQRQARKAALNDLKNNIYTIERYSNAAETLRVVSPFIAATNNTLRVWGKLIGKNPQIIPRANQLWNSPVRAGLVVQTDEEGNYQRVNSDSDGIGLSSAYGMVIPIPGPVARKFGVPEDFKLVPPLSSMNVALQSDPVWLPGWGPLVTVPFATYANRNPTNWFVETFGGYFFPQQGDTSKMQSPKEPWKAALPAYIRQAFNREDPDGSQRTSIFATLAANEYRKAYETGDYSFFDKDGKWKQQLEKETDAYFSMRIFGAATLPFAANVQDPEAMFYISQYRAYQRAGEVNGVSATERFIADYGEAFRGYTFSASKNNTGAAADADVQRRIDALDPTLLDSLGDLNPFLIGAIVNNPDGSYNFSSPVLNKQGMVTTGPTANLKFREAQTGAQAAERTMVAQGWQEYTNSRKSLDAWMRQNNITSLRSVPGEQAAWQAYVEDLKTRNQAWAQEYSQRDDGQYQRTAQGFEQAFSVYPNIVSARPEMAKVQEYLASRKALADYLASGYAPARTLSAAANSTERANWETYVRGLLNGDERFADLYFQFFDGEFGRLETPEGF